MSVTRDSQISPVSHALRERTVYQKESVVASQAAVRVFRFTPGAAFEIMAVRAWMSAGHANARVDVRISGTTVLSATLAPAVAGTAPSLGSLVAQASRYGTSADTIDVYVTTGAGETMTDLNVDIDWRYRTARGDPT